MRASLIVAAAAENKRLTTEATARALACLSTDVPTATVEALIDAASAAIARHINVAGGDDGGVTLGSELLKETWRLQPGQTIRRALPLARWPVTELVAVSENGSRLARFESGADAAIDIGVSATTLVSATGPDGADFTSAHTGRAIVIAGAGASGAPLATTIAAVTDGQTVTLAASAQTTVAGAAYTVENPGFPYAVRAQNGLLLNTAADGSTQAWAGPLIVIEYRAGFYLPADAAPTLPADLDYACALLVKRKLERIDEGDNARIKSESFAGIGAWTYAVEEIDWSGGLPRDVAELLKPYRRMTV